MPNSDAIGTIETPPAHYALRNDALAVSQPIDAIFALGWGRAFCCGNALKYLTRSGRKDGAADVDDLKKAQRYIEFVINDIETGHPRRL